MREILVGNTGFVGSNLASQYHFSACYHASDIANAYGTKPDLLVYAGVRSEMFLANSDPEKDYAQIVQAMENIRRCEPARVILISTVAVYPNTDGVNEDTVIELTDGSAYGRNRHCLEKWVEQNDPSSLIVRLPAIFGRNLKKNFIYDYLHRIPALLSRGKYDELRQKAPVLTDFFSDRGDGFYACRKLSDTEAPLLKECFDILGFSALNFTDSRSRYQFYPLSRLWSDVTLAMAHDVRRLNLVTPPLSAGELYRELCGDAFVNKLPKAPYRYDIKTKHDFLFGHDDGYIMSLEEEMKYIQDYVLDTARQRNME